MLPKMILSASILLVGWGAIAAAEDLQITPAVLSAIDVSQVAAEEVGVIAAIHVDVGQYVDAGTRLADLDPRDAELELDRARIELERAAQAANDVDVRSAKESLNLAELDLRRAREAVDRYAKSVSGAQIDRLEVIVARARLDVERSERDAQAARLAIEAAKNGVRTAERGRERRQIVAPIEGTVVSVDVRPGEWVDLGKPVLRIVNIHRLRAEAFVEFNRLRSDIHSQEVIFSTRLAEEGQTDFRGMVTFVSPEVNRVNGQVRVWAEIDNSQQRLRPGMTGTLTILAPGSPQASAQGPKNLPSAEADLPPSDLPPEDAPKD